MHKNRFRSGRVFTLIELLVVIAIIAVLASLLLPALQRARDYGKTAVCIGNLKQYNLAYADYIDDSDGVLGCYQFPTALKPLGYLPYPKDHSTSHYSGHITQSVNLCPSAPIYNRKHWYPGNGYASPPTAPETNFWLGSTYGFNNYLNWSDGTVMYYSALAGYAWPYQWGIHSRPSRIRRPSEFVYIGDKPMVWGGTGSYYLPVGTPSYHHGKGKMANILWLDGHISTELRGSEGFT